MPLAKDEERREQGPLQASPPGQSGPVSPARKSTSPPQDAPAFVFVDGQRQRQDRGTRTLIRTHVMRNFRQQHESNPGQEPPENHAKPSRTVIGQKQKFKLTTKNLEPVKPSRSRSKPNAARGRNAQPKPRRPGEGTFQITLVKPVPGGVSEPSNTPADLPADSQDDFSWMTNPDYDVDEDLFAFETIEETPQSSTGKLHPIFAELQPWEQQIQDLSDAIPLTSPIDIAGLTQSRLDPFDSLPVRLNPATEVLIDRCRFHFISFVQEIGSLLLIPDIYLT
jgi:hypothetical protein